MKKILKSLIVILPVIWAASTWLISNKTESMADNMLAQATTQIGGGNMLVEKIEKQSYQKGFTSSTMQSVMTLNPDLFDDASVGSVTLNHKIYHGPVMMTSEGIKLGSSYTVTTIGDLPEKIAALATLFFGDNEPVVIGTKTGLPSGDIALDYTVAPFSFDAAKYSEVAGIEMSSDAVNVTIAGLSAVMVSNQAGTKVSGTMDVGAINITDPVKEGVTMTMVASTLDLDATDIYKGSLLTGEFSYAIPAMAFIDDEAGINVTLKDFAIGMRSAQENSHLNSRVSIHTAALEVQSAKQSDDNLPPSKIQLEVGFGGMAKEKMVNLIDLTQNMRIQQMAMMNNEAPEKAELDSTMSALTDYYRMVVGTIEQGVNTDLTFTFSNKNGEASAKIELEYTDAQSLYEMKTVGDVTRATQGAASVNIDKSLIADTALEGAIAMPVMLGFAVDAADNYHTTASLTLGELTLNEQPVPFLDMMGEAPIDWASLLSE